MLPEVLIPSATAASAARKNLVISVAVARPRGFRLFRALNVNVPEGKGADDRRVKKGDSAPRERGSGGLGEELTPEALAKLARVRASNASTRILVSAICGLGLAVIVSHWAPVLWALTFAIVLLLERRFALGLARIAESGKRPAITAYAVWTFCQSFYGAMLAPMAWFMEPRSGDALAAFFLIAASANVLLTLRASTVLTLCGVGATFLMTVALPLIDLFYWRPANTVAELAPLLAAALMLGPGFFAWRGLRATDRSHRLAKEAARRAQAMSKDAANARADFVAIMKHEVRTPMAALTAASTALRAVSLPPEARVQVEAIADAADVLAGVLDDLIELDALENGALPVNPRPTDPRALVRSVATTFKSQAEEKGIELLIDLADNAPREVLIDPLRVRQVLFNLVSNAVNFTKVGGVRVRLQVQPGKTPDRVRLGVAVADTGVGMSRTELAMHIGSQRAPGGRKGLGLAIASKLAVLMGARLGAKSTPGEGSVFSLVLEAEIVADKPIEAPQTPCYLIVEHLAPERRVIAAILDSTAARYEFAESSARALEMLHERRFDLVIADQRLPEFDAMDVAELLRQGGPNAATPVIALAMDAGVAQMCHESGVQGAVILPVTPTALLDEAARVLGAAPPSATWAA